MKIICHGGAGHTPKVQDGVDKAAEAGWKVLRETNNALEAAITATMAMEDDFRLQGLEVVYVMMVESKMMLL